MVTTIRALALLVALQVAAPQAHPDFSGEWALARDRSSQTLSGATVTAVAGLLGEKFTAKQDVKTLTIDITSAVIGRPVRVVYNLDGTESRNFNPSQVPGVADEPIVSRATWDSQKLVILTRGSTLVNGKPLESKRVIWVDADGLLTIERSSEGAPTTVSVYRKTTGTGNAPRTQN